MMMAISALEVNVFPSRPRAALDRPIEVGNINQAAKQGIETSSNIIADTNHRFRNFTTAVPIGWKS